ncbi:MAG: hypothetical protein H7A35_00615 [Planctomycetales bacterium]|nr:hypothetical protein [bacterium]UNM08565.1 MAG: hypothetical protein H7A35_00615 [Planctomycetales bacterium]
MRLESDHLWQRGVQDVRLSVDKYNGLASELDAILYAQFFDELIDMHFEHDVPLPSPEELSSYLVRSGWSDECAIEVEEFYDNILLYRRYKAGQLLHQRPEGHFREMA